MSRKDCSTGAIGVTAAALAILAGDMTLQSLPWLPPAWLYGLLAGAGALGCWRLPRLRWLALLVLAFAWTGWRADLAMQARLPKTLEGRDFDVTGTVRGLPQTSHGITRFTLDIGSASLLGRPQKLHGKLRLFWYGAPHDSPQPCTEWRLRLRLKRPRALLDPGSFDSERQALQKGIVARGYVLADALNARLGTQTLCVDRLRALLSAAIAAQLGGRHASHLLQALAVGDKRGLQEHDWQVARVNGISHLLAISGFHVGIAALLGACLSGLLWFLVPALGLKLPCRIGQAMAALLTASAYALLAGFSLPTQRSLLMIAVLSMACVLRRAGGGVQSLALALLVILVLDPLALLSAGFWLSFAGVAVLYMGVQQGRGVLAWWRTLGSTQCFISIALLPLSVCFFGQASLLAVVSNLFAIPLVSLLVVPLTLLGSLAMAISPDLAGVLWKLAAWPLARLWCLLEDMARLPMAHWYLPLAPLWVVVLAMLGALWLLVPRGLPARCLGALLFLPLLLPAIDLPQQGAFKLSVLDVGQGLSVLVRTRRHTLLYDAGARYPSGLDLGQTVVLPAMRALGVHHLDEMMISHGDNDHAGGAPVVAEAFPGAYLSGSEPRRTHLPLNPCRAGQHWRWDGVDFRVLHPRDAWPQGSNDGSCVLLVSTAGGRLLLTGDISSLVEQDVAELTGKGSPLVLLVPHHGSKTSSSQAFLHRLAPFMAVVSAGWRNRFGHPAKQVVARYHNDGIRLFNTATSGALMLDFPSHGKPRLQAQWRMRQRRYWRE